MPMHNPPHPGAALREDVLPALDLSATALAQHIGYSPLLLSSVLNGHAPITADLAHRLELSGLGAARQFLAEQIAHDLWHAQQRAHPAITPLAIKP
ncbi:HigA family addiction module antitoxin [Acidovorax sp. NCPPB 3576]|uniref:HigA family addiction module antitoxin n=1 Tax=Acidovorax sp. NCPPB 3576 TaxID=2940488 RepID=UPI00234B4402|nr:HigA family addiction module antitoxin [Acidovorax sp. NCPPB 3576]WCM86880.1 HigA family addiction module antitoxin [Acidovorax sp. NCPPB 3576]